MTCTLIGAVLYILHNMNDESQYDDFLDQFTYIEFAIEDSDDLLIAFGRVMDDLYDSKGNLSNSVDSLQQFLNVIR